MAESPSWFASFPAAVTVSDRDGVILAMNEAAVRAYANEGGRDLIGRNMLDCHPPAAREKLRGMLAEGLTNCYTIERNGRKKLIYQAPWYEAGECRGLVEIVIALPAEMPHFVRG